ncbi:MAG: SRPBCC family protein [Parvularculaceae bacterium]
MDPDAPALDDFLGEVGKLGLTTIAAHGDIAVVDGVQKYRMACNWKLAVDNIYDWYHPPITHVSALGSGYVSKVPWGPMDHVVSLGEYGHAISGPRMDREMRASGAKEAASSDCELREDETWRDRPDAFAQLGEFGAEQRGHPGIFPNLWVASSGTQLSLRLPRGPESTEIWWFTLLDKNLSPEERAEAVSRANHFFGPAGLFEQDDGENWDQGTRASRGLISKRYPMNFAMNLGHGVIKQHPSGVAHIDAPLNEHAQLWTYRAWADWMAARDWAELKRNHAVPSGVM